MFSIIKDNQSVISQRIGRNVCIKKIGVRSIDKYSHLDDPALLTNRIDDIINDIDQAINKLENKVKNVA